jgi:hypothetical protein
MPSKSGDAKKPNNLKTVTTVTTVTSMYACVYISHKTRGVY